MASIMHPPRIPLNSATTACIRCRLRSLPVGTNNTSPSSSLSLPLPSRRKGQMRFFSQQPQMCKQFTYHAAAAFTAKHRKFDPYLNVFHFSPYNRIQTEKKKPKSKRPDSGQDAFFIARVGDTNAVAFGIADGVGGWEESGVDPADFSHSFCDYMASAAYEHRSNDSGSGSGSGSGDAPPAPLNSRSLMQRGYDDVCKDKSIHAGGSTACIGIANEDGTLDVANLGDSGFVQMRLNGVHSYSDPQTHAFNTPFQLSIVPASMLARAAAFGGAQLCDYPRDADVTQHKLKHGDILVFASDGVWDNLFNQDILRIASRLMTGSGAWKSTEGGIRVVDNLGPFTEGEVSAQRPLTMQSALAVEITGAAKAASINRRVDGPFAKEVQKFYPQENWHGGKVDDICVVVVLVSEDVKTQATKSKL